MKKILFGFLIAITFPLSIYPQRYWNMNEVASINCPDVKFGYAIANGDVNGDGFSDLIVGSYTSLNLDKVYIWLGGAPFDTIIDITLTGHHFFGQVIACGDVNNDGYDDVLIGTCPHGVVRLYYGGNPMDTTADWIVHSGEDAVALSDLNGDGNADLIVGAGHAGPNNNGAVYIYWGGENPDTLYDVVMSGIEHACFGSSISSSKYDVNGDGAPDLAVGAPDFFSPPSFPKISIFYGSNGINEFDTIPDVKIYNPCNELLFGNTISLLKDVNGDGYDDLAAGAGGHNSVYIYYGGNPMDSIYDVVLSGDTLGFGESVAGIDRANNDNFGDILVGNPHYGPGNGRIYLYCGGNPFDSFPDAYAMGEYNKHIGWSVGYARDLDNDGKDEMVFSNYVVSSPTIWITNYIETGVEEEKDRRHKTKDMRLHCHPNPFTTSTTISLTLPSIGHSAKGIGQNKEGIELKIYDVSGRLVRRLGKIPDSQLPILNYIWDGRDENSNKVSTGIYFIKAKIENIEINQKVVYVR